MTRLEKFGLLLFILTVAYYPHLTGKGQLAGMAIVLLSTVMFLYSSEKDEKENENNEEE